MSGIVRAVFPQLCLLRKRGYTLNMLVGLFQENGVRITATALSGYMKKLNKKSEGASAIEVRKQENTAFVTWFISLQTLGNETGCTVVRKELQ
jgi:hypothetical protein